MKAIKKKKLSLAEQINFGGKYKSKPKAKSSKKGIGGMILGDRPTANQQRRKLRK